MKPIKTQNSHDLKDKQKNAVKLLRMISEGENIMIEPWQEKDSKIIQFQTNKCDSQVEVDIKKFKQFTSERKLTTQSTFQDKKQKQAVIFRKRMNKKISTFTKISRNYSEKVQQKYEQNKQKLHDKQRQKQQHQYYSHLAQGQKTKPLKRITIGSEVSSKLIAQKTNSFLLKVTKYGKYQQQSTKSPQQKLKQNLVKYQTQKTKEQQYRKIKINQLIRKKMSKKNYRKMILCDNVYKVGEQERDINNNSVHQNKSNDNKHNEQMKLKIDYMNYEPIKSGKILKSWLDSNRYQRKRSISSLLRSHFNGFNEKSSPKIKFIKSARIVSFTANPQHNNY